MFQFIKKWFNKKNKKDMITEEQIINYKQNFTGQTFQWVKPDDSKLLGKVVKCRDIDVYGGRVMAIFDNGSKVDIQDLNRKLFMVHGDMPPLTLPEIESIYPSQKPSTPPPVQPRVHVEPNSNYNSDNMSQSSSSSSRSNPFEMFNSDAYELLLKLNIKLPNQDLLKLMYTNAKDKEDFLTELSEHVMSMINKNIVHESLRQILDPGSKAPKTGQPKKSSGTEIKLTEVND
jgi:hypothetical protein